MNPLISRALDVAEAHARHGTASEWSLALKRVRSLDRAGDADPKRLRFIVALGSARFGHFQEARHSALQIRADGAEARAELKTALLASPESRLPLFQQFVHQLALEDAIPSPTARSLAGRRTLVLAALVVVLSSAVIAVVVIAPRSSSSTSNSRMVDSDRNSDRAGIAEPGSWPPPKLVLPPLSSHASPIERAAENTLLVLVEANVRSGTTVSAEPVALGSAFVVSKEGLLVTNRHVVEQVSSLPRDDSDVLSCRVLIGIRRPTLHWAEARIDRLAGDVDLAILRTDEHFSDALELASVPTIGTDVTAAGFPLGLDIATIATMSLEDRAKVFRETFKLGDKAPSRELILTALGTQAFTATVTRGIVSAVRVGEHWTIIQTDAFVQHGSSGGPLIDAKGRVVGVMTAGMGEKAESINFAIGADAVQSLLSGSAR